MRSTALVDKWSITVGNNTNLTVTQLKLRTRITGPDANNRTRELGVQGTDQVTWFISLKRFCARSHSGALCGGVVKVIRQEPFQQRTVSQSIGFQVAQYQRNPEKWISCLCWNPSQSTMLLLAISGWEHPYASVSPCPVGLAWPGLALAWLARLGPAWPAWPGLAQLAWGTRQI